MPGAPSFWLAGSRKAAERAKDAILLVGGERDGRAERQGFGRSILDLQHGTGSTCEGFSVKKANVEDIMRGLGKWRGSQGIRFFG